jgi:glutamate/tyrosine decarboxylase-like PLP-dependent enzyme
MNADQILSFDPETRRKLWNQLMESIEDYLERVPEANPSPVSDLENLRTMLAEQDFNQQINPEHAMDFVIRNLWENQVHTPHPRYFGLFNPATTSMGIAADALAAAFNPQLATINHSPFAVEVERHLVHTFGQRFGYKSEEVDGTFTNAGAEANHTALITALTHQFPDFARKGLRGLERQPVLYLSNQSHHSLVKAARLCGLGSDAIHWIPVNDRLQLEVNVLERQIAQDRADGFAPFLVVATAGTTNAGVVDPIASVAEIASRERLWLHVDAAWGGAVVFIPELSDLIKGIEQADSITFDAHKWLSVPMAAGMYLTRHPQVLSQAFRITAEYMPTAAEGEGFIDPYTHSIQWSRRFIGLKVFLSLLVAGWEGYRQVIQHQVELGDLMREKLAEAMWEVVNPTPLPVVCFTNPNLSQVEEEKTLEGILREVLDSGKAWISITRLDKNRPVLRACITNYRTKAEDIQILVEELNNARERLKKR